MFNDWILSIWFLRGWATFWHRLLRWSSYQVYGPANTVPHSCSTGQWCFSHLPILGIKTWNEKKCPRSICYIYIYMYLFSRSVSSAVSQRTRRTVLPAYGICSQSKAPFKIEWKYVFSLSKKSATITSTHEPAFHLHKVIKWLDTSKGWNSSLCLSSTIDQQTSLYVVYYFINRRFICCFH